MITEKELQNMIDVEITVSKENFAQLSEYHREFFKDFDVYSECEIDGITVLLFEDFGVIAPADHYDKFIAILESLPAKSYRLNIFNDYSEEIIKTSVIC